MKKSETLLVKYNTSYQSRKKYLKEKFDNDMKPVSSENKIYVFNNFKKTYATITQNYSHKLQFDQLNNDIIHLMKFNENCSFESLLIKYIKENNPNPKFLENFGIYMAEYDFRTFLNEHESDFDDTRNKPSKGSDKEHTIRRKILSVHYLLKELKTFDSKDKTEIAEFIRFLTGKELNAKDIKNTNIYKFLCNPFNIGDKALKSDLKYVQEYYKKLGLFNIVDGIEKEIKSH